MCLRIVLTMIFVFSMLENDINYNVVLRHLGGCV